MNSWGRFWVWYNKHVLESLVISAIIIYAQVPHMVWAGDAYLQTGYISYIHPALDFFLYGIDLVEIIGIINITMLLINEREKRKNAQLDRNRAP